MKRLHFALVISLFLSGTAIPALAQSDAEGAQRCALMTKQMVDALLPAIRGQGNCQIRCHGCGCKGGPGYRDSDGKCVAWSQLIRRCGPSPHSGCTAECFPVVEGCEHTHAWLDEKLKAAGMKPTYKPYGTASPSDSPLSPTGKGASSPSAATD